MILKGEIYPLQNQNHSAFWNILLLGTVKDTGINKVHAQKHWLFVAAVLQVTNFFQSEAIQLMLIG